jgi:hypothetical protein
VCFSLRAILDPDRACICPWLSLGVRHRRHSALKKLSDSNWSLNPRVSCSALVHPTLAHDGHPISRVRRVCCRVTEQLQATWYNRTGLHSYLYGRSVPAQLKVASVARFVGPPTRMKRCRQRSSRSRRGRGLFGPRRSVEPVASLLGGGVRNHCARCTARALTERLGELRISRAHPFPSARH